jgi:molybdopterin-guanine dinucleotide biosynthesis protein A
MEKPVLGVVLAGGRGSRLGGVDKAMVTVAGRPLLAHVLDRLVPQVTAVVVNANGAADRFAAFGLPIIADETDDRPGPLAGILAGLDRAAADGHALAVTVSCDAPCLPPDLVSRFLAALEAGAPGAVAVSGGRRHPAVALWPSGAAGAVRAALLRGERRVDDVARALGLAEVVWPAGSFDPFFNVNEPQDIKAAELILAQGR